MKTKKQFLIERTNKIYLMANRKMGDDFAKWFNRYILNKLDKYENTI